MIGKTVEVAVTRSGSRDGRTRREWQVIPLAQVIKKEERLVLNDGPADGTAEFMNLLNSFLERIQVGHALRYSNSAITFQHRMIGVERRILAVVIKRAVKVVGA